MEGEGRDQVGNVLEGKLGRGKGGDLREKLGVKLIDFPFSLLNHLINYSFIQSHR